MIVPPGPKGHFLVGCLPELRRDFLGFVTACARDYGDIVAIPATRNKFVIVSHPDAVEEVLVARARHFTKSSLLKRHLLPVIGEGLLLSEGEDWLRQRRLMQPAFHHQRVAAYGELMVGCAELAMTHWQDGSTRDVYSDMMALTQVIVAKTLLDIDVADTRYPIGAALQEAMAEFSRRRPFRLPGWIRTLARRRKREAFGHLDDMVCDLIKSRRACAADRGDVLSMLLQAKNTAGSPLSDREVRDQILTLFLAGQETTALLLSCTWSLLSQHPEVESRLEAELGAVLAGRLPTLADVPRLPYTDMVLKETMRLYPPAHAIFRTAADPCKIAGYEIEPGTEMVMPQCLVHRDRRWFEEPNAFDPGRWEKDSARHLPRYAYFPFGGGPRQCLGKAFAVTEAALLLATIGQRFRFSLHGEDSAMQLSSGSQRTTRRLKMTLAHRQGRAPAPAPLAGAIPNIPLTIDAGRA